MSSSVAKPIIKQIKDRQDALDFFEHVSLPKEDEKTQEIIMNFPTVYIHNWQESGDFEVYVGESNDIFKRTRQHYDAASDNSKWQSKLLEKDASLFIIGHEHFNKSLTLAFIIVSALFQFFLRYGKETSDRFQIHLPLIVRLILLCQPLNCCKNIISLIGQSCSLKNSFFPRISI